MPAANLTNKQVGYLLVLNVSGKDKWRYNLWKCLCICGKVLYVRSSSLLHARTRSCGCKIAEIQRDNPRQTTHGQAKIRNGKRTSSEYSVYAGARQRCNNPDNKAYKDYGGRGIKFLFTSFEQFFAELGRRPKGLTLDRIDNDGHYAPGNVRWTTWEQQVKSKRKREKFNTPERSTNGRFKKQEIVNG